ncbi:MULTISPECIES: NgoMIV family type II restriction endonuclease [unclassified Streptomyces]|uniref:NgoMIV family type II restriction endonuclease n=1 Tax=unclassified Streptomyces TaxID=2593676 RepID=UPI00381AAC4B
MPSTPSSGLSGTSLPTEVFGWRVPDSRKRQRLVPNIVDVGNDQSADLAISMMRFLGVGKEHQRPARENPGKRFEVAVLEHLSQQLKQHGAADSWLVERGRAAKDFAQYAHLAAIDTLMEQSPELRATIGTDYMVTPDVTVSIPDAGELIGNAPWLHAAISCKWTIRSDRVQNIRHEFNGLIRHRRGRQPHLITVTAEPLPSRIVAIARGTGELDAVYHVAYEALDQAVRAVGNDKQRADWEECVKLRRVLPYEQLAETLIRW